MQIPGILKLNRCFREFIEIILNQYNYFFQLTKGIKIDLKFIPIIWQVPKSAYYCLQNTTENIVYPSSFTSEVKCSFKFRNFYEINLIAATETKNSLMASIITYHFHLF